MSTYTDIFKIETNHVVPVRGKVLISEPFLCDKMFGRSVVLLIDHTSEGTMGLVLNKPFPLSLSDIFHDIAGGRNIPIYRGGHHLLPTHHRGHPRRFPRGEGAVREW